jgi:hypothetical protein
VLEAFEYNLIETTICTGIPLVVAKARLLAAGMGVGRISADPAATPGNPTLRRLGARHADQRCHAGAGRRTLLPRQGAAPSSVRRWSIFQTSASVA